MNNNRGASLVETLIALAISIPLLCGFVTATAGIARIGMKQRGSLDELSTIVKIDTYLDTMLADLDRHRLPLFPVVHKHGKIMFADGTMNPISLRTDNLRPIARSDAITYFSTSSLQSLRVVKIDASTSPVSIYGCAKYNTSTFDETAILGSQSFLGIDTSGIAEYVGTIKKWGHSAPYCYELSITVASGMISHSISRPSTYLSLIYPLNRVYTLYVSAAEELRYLGHLGRDIIENQPIRDEIYNLTFSESLKSSAFLLLRSTLQPTSTSKTKSLIHLSRVGRTPLYNLILN